MVKISASGVIQWSRKFGGAGIQNANDIIQLSEGGFIIAGINNGTPSNSDSADIYVIETDSLGNTPNCSTGTTTATVTNPPFTVNSSFVWASITNLSFGPTTITPIVISSNPLTTTLCSTSCIPDSIINDYTPVLALDICKNILTVEDASHFNTGDTVLLIQMKGAIIDSSNTAAFGTITDYKNAGNYEFNYVKNKTGNMIELKNTITRKYDVPNGKAQLVRVPYYQNANIPATLTCLPWDGSKGGVLVLNAADSIILNSDIDVSGRGFRGGHSPNTGSTTLYCFYNNYYYASGNLGAAAKGESISTIGNAIAWGKGSPSNGGGGGSGHNSGGGGGANGSSGGLGGYQLLTCGGAPFDNRGIGGHALTYNNALNRIYMGGGGGSGHVDNAGGSDMEGGNGGGIIIIRSNVIKPNGFKISSNGNNARQCDFVNFTDCHDGSGGGGSGGTILIENNNYLPATQIDAKGGKGGDLIIYNPPAGADKIGPGGGGSGGVVWFNSVSSPANTSSALDPGANGVIIPNGNDPWGATPGQNGTTLFNLVVPVDNIPFKTNIDSVRIKDSATACNSFDFKGLGYTNTNPIAIWQWFFGDGGTATTQNASHLYASAGTYIVKLVVTDINGCKDSISTSIMTIIPVTPSITINTTNNICQGNPATFTATAINGGTTPIYQWLINGNPVGTNSNIYTDPAPNNGDIIKCRLTSSISCVLPVTVESNSITMSVSSPPSNLRYPTLTATYNQPLQLQARNLGGNSYNWQPTIGLNDHLLINPVFSFSQTQEYKIL